MVTVNSPQKTNERCPRSRVFATLVCASVCLFSIQGQAQSFGDERFDCLIEPKMTVMVGAPTQGVIDTVEVERSDLVSAGQVLARLHSEVESAALEHARVRATMKSEIQARQADLELAQLNMRRIEELFGKQMVPQQKRDEANAQLRVAEMALKQARDNKTLYEHEFARARRVVEQRIIRSPISGVVVEQRAYPGEFVYENPVVTIAQLDPLRIEAILPARYFGKVKPGLSAIIDPEVAAGGAALSGVIHSVDRLIDAASGTFSVHLELDNPNNQIPGGQRCTVSFLPVTADEQLAARE